MEKTKAGIAKVCGMTQSHLQLPENAKKSPQGLPKARNGLKQVILAVGTSSLFASLAQAGPSPTFQITGLQFQNGMAIVSWQGGGTSNQLQRATSVSGPWQDVDVPTTATRLTNISTVPMAFYRIMNAANNPAAATDRQPPTTPGSFTASAVSCSQVNLSWSASTDPSPSSGIKGYDLYRNGYFLTQIAASASLTYVDAGLAPYTTYTYAVLAIDNAGHSSAKASAVVVTPSCSGGDTVPPSVNLVSPIASSTVSGAISLAASAVDNPGGTGVASVEFYCDNSASPLARVTASPYTATCDTTTMQNGSHNFYAKAYDAAGNAATSATVPVTVNNQVAGTWPWAKSSGGSASDVGQAVATDKAGNIYLAGYFGSSIDFGNGTGLLTCAGGVDIFLVKFNAAGVAQWARRFGGSGNEYANSIAVDANGNIFVGGYYNGTTDLGTGPITASYSSDMFIAKYSPNGTPLWAKSFGSSGLGAGFDSVTGLATDTNGNVVVTGFFQGSQIDFGAGIQYNGVGSYDSFLAKFGGNGSLLWSRVFACDTDNQANGVAVDSNGDIVVVGKQIGSVDLSNNGGLLPYPHPATTLTTLGGSDFYVGKFAADGTYIWSKHFGGSQNDNALGVAVDSSRNIFVSGYFTSSMDMGVGQMLTAGTMDLFVSKLSSSGACVWSKSLAGGQFQTISGVAVDVSGNVAITGYFNQSLNFGNGSVSSSALFQNTAFVAKYSGSASGLNPANYLWEQSLNGNGGNQSYGITTDGAGHLIATGCFGGTASIANSTITSSGSYDVYLIGLNP